MIELTIEQAKLALSAIQAYPWEHRAPEMALANLLLVKIERAKAKAEDRELDSQTKAWHKKLGAGE